MNESDRDELIAAYLAGEASQIEALELDEAAIEELLDLLEMEGLLKHIMQPADPQSMAVGVLGRITAEKTEAGFLSRVENRLKEIEGPPSRRRKAIGQPRSKSSILAWATAAAAALLLLVGHLTLWGPEETSRVSQSTDDSLHVEGRAPVLDTGAERKAEPVLPLPTQEKIAVGVPVPESSVTPEAPHVQETATLAAVERLTVPGPAELEPQVTPENVAEHVRQPKEEPVPPVDTKPVLADTVASAEKPLVDSIKAGDTAKFLQLAGAVHIIRPSEGRMNAGDGLEFAPGDILETGDGTAFVSYPDLMRLGLSPGTKITSIPGSGRQASLERGRLTVDVGTQSKERKVQITTPHARVEVLGTQFTLLAGANSTRLEVDEGVVRFTLLRSGKSVIVRAGRCAEAAENKLSLVPYLFKVLLCCDFEHGECNPWKLGAVESGPGRPGNRYSLVSVKGDCPDLGQMVRLGSRAAALFTYSDTTMLQFDYWVSKRERCVHLRAWNHTQQQRYDSRFTDIHRERWSRAVVRIADFQPVSSKTQGWKKRDGISSITIAGSLGTGPLYIDNIRVIRSKQGGR